MLRAEYLPNKILVELKPGSLTVQSGSSAAEVSLRLEKLLNNYGTAEIKKVSDTPRGRGLLQSSAADPLADYYSVEYPASINVELLVEILKNDPEVAAAQPVFIYRIQATPDDKKYLNQAWYFDLINAPAGWDITTGSTAVKIAVVDSGVAPHSDLDLDTAGWRDFVTENNLSPVDPNGHGTIVAGLAAAIGNNDTGITGLDWNAKILPVRVMNDNGAGDTTAIAKGIKHAADQGADVINMSFGGLSDSLDNALEKACDYAHSKGSILVAAAGNIGGNIYADSIVYPAVYENVLSVGSVNNIGNRSIFSVKNPNVMAPGEKMFSTDKSGDYSNQSDDGKYFDGTSFAAPLVSGLMGLLRAQNPTVNPQEAMEIVKKTAKPAGSFVEYGWGIVDVYHALTRVPYPRDSGGGKNLKVLSAPNPAQRAVNFSFPLDEPVDNVRIYIYDQRGRKAQELDYGSSLLGSMYVTPEWDLLGADGRALANGSYIYVVKATTKDGSVKYGKNILSIVR
ncbi:putative protease [Candidatus Termititenax aidoneus]|uniref:Protease n=1 Tax=Termititenax aidoneus TaxID=2218524 RepID=A0A388TBF0_TERA1|nr:putative protease [Candidatus Termititenax aidoneus]